MNTSDKMDKRKVAIIDYGLGNIFSISQAILHVGAIPVITKEPGEILNASHLVLPGVGAFGDAMQVLDQLDLIPVILDYVQTGKPLMGICLGMQLLFEKSEEFGTNTGLGLIEGNIVKFPSQNSEKERIKVPQIAWNQIYKKDAQGWDDSPLSSLEEGSFMYFVHSFYTKPQNEDSVLSTTNYAGINYCSSVKKENIFGFQFHPEKSGHEGLKIYRNFINI